MPTQILKESHERCRKKLEEIRSAMSELDSLLGTEHLTIYLTGSYGRGEAGVLSDLDPFFLHSGSSKESRLKKDVETKIFSNIAKICNNLGFPPFTDGGRYLEIHYVNDRFPEIGSIKDDYTNFLTARLLMLLEGTYIFNQVLYNRIIIRILDWYYRDYEYYKDDFMPLSLINDIIRFWKTFCINYEFQCSKRSLLHRDKGAKAAGIEFSERNDLLKLKFSRLLTCYSMVLALAAHGEGIKHHEMRSLVRKRPLQRLKFVAKLLPDHISTINEMISLYEEFLLINHLDGNMRFKKLMDENNYNKILESGQRFGDLIYQIIINICDNDSKRRFLIV